jgi:hypothetical protein
LVPEGSDAWNVTNFWDAQILCVLGKQSIIRWASTDTALQSGPVHWCRTGSKHTRDAESSGGRSGCDITRRSGGLPFYFVWSIRHQCWKQVIRGDVCDQMERDLPKWITNDGFRCTEGPVCRLPVIGWWSSYGMYEDGANGKQKCTEISCVCVMEPCMHGKNFAPSKMMDCT